MFACEHCLQLRAVLKTHAWLCSLSYVIVRPAIIYGVADKLGISKTICASCIKQTTFDVFPLINLTL